MYLRGLSSTLQWQQNSLAIGKIQYIHQSWSKLKYPLLETCTNEIKSCVSPLIIKILVTTINKVSTNKLTDITQDKIINIRSYFLGCLFILLTKNVSNCLFPHNGNMLPFIFIHLFSSSKVLGTFRFLILLNTQMSYFITLRQVHVFYIPTFKQIFLNFKIHMIVQSLSPLTLAAQIHPWTLTIPLHLARKGSNILYFLYALAFLKNCIIIHPKASHKRQTYSLNMNHI